ncbi:hypothetical protein CWC22_007935 [Pseudoalteromonas rubra]|uniref:Uncharacterized protein n=1 Tax=Pseudoalteromonas rubra TaxID=43658 RepID=A0A5S3UUK8_9GAMM|nr:hypothetical protein [Pseudoalteromonas rubra]QPB82921.1 hypothetical protein CWC22_007935 [Pseudoalteromonas rubra]
MWTVVKISRELQFYNFQTGEFQDVGHIRYARAEELNSRNGVQIDQSGIADIILDHDKCVSELIAARIPLFPKKVMPERRQLPLT